MLINACGGDAVYLWSLLLNVSKHMSGNCTPLCLHGVDGKPSYEVTEPDAIQALHDLFSRYANDAEKYASDCRSNVVESVNHSIAMTARKNTHYGGSYAARASQGILYFAQGGFNSIINIIDHSSHSLSQAATTYLQKLQQQQFNQREKKQQPDYPQKRQAVKENKKKRALAAKDIVEVDVTVGGVTKKQRVEYGGSGEAAVIVVKCGCKSGCATNHCACYKAKQRCGTCCNCKSCTNQG